MKIIEKIKKLFVKEDEVKCNLFFNNHFHSEWFSWDYTFPKKLSNSQIIKKIMLDVSHRNYICINTITRNGKEIYPS